MLGTCKIRVSDHKQQDDIEDSKIMRYLSDSPLLEPFDQNELSKLASKITRRYYAGITPTIAKMRAAYL